MVRKGAERSSAFALNNQSVRAAAFASLHLLTESASVESNGLFYLFPTSDWIIGRSLYMRGRWDDEFLECAVDLAARLSSAPPFSGGVVVVVDVGANIGTTSLQMLKRFEVSRVVAVEPHPVCLRYLQANIAANGYSSKCTIIHAAASDVAGEVALETNTDNSGGAQIIPSATLASYVVQSETLDAMVLSNDIDPADLSLVWVDAEGHEYRVMKGAARIIEAKVPFLIEFWPQRLRENGDFDLLVDLIVDCVSRIMDVRTHVERTRPHDIPPTRAGILKASVALDAWPTDLLLIP
jgi:FkbM family methyltransferase